MKTRVLIEMLNRLNPEHDVIVDGMGCDLFFADVSEGSLGEERTPCNVIEVSASEQFAAASLRTMARLSGSDAEERSGWSKDEMATWAKGVLEMRGE